jgi:diguanylate cyclase (GGDEF)-like protein/PAS domain S-box-containing protein
MSATTMTDQSPADEAERLDAVRKYQVLDTPSESDYDDLTRLAAATCETPLAAITFLDEKRLWFKSKVGLEVSELSRDISLCTLTIQHGNLLEIPDTLLDERCWDNPLVKGDVGARFYAGMPLITPKGHIIGALCVGDRVPRILTTAQKDALRVLARQVIVLCMLRQKVAPETDVPFEPAALREELAISPIVENLSDGFFLVDHATGLIRQANANFLSMLGYTAAEIVRLRPHDFHAHAVADSTSTSPSLKDHGLCDLGRCRYQRKDGTLVDVAVKVAFIPNDGEGLAGVIVQDITAQRRYEDQILTYQLELETANAKLRTLAMTDGLTGVRNRTAFNDRLNHEYEIAARYTRALSLVLIDVDHFKAFNDTFGHPAGDEVLKQIADLLNMTARNTDTVARYGGEEFAIILPETDFEGAMTLAERCRLAVETAPWSQRPLTISLGVATLTSIMVFPGALIQDADEALYLAKHFGRNRVHHGHESTRPAEETPDLIPLDYNKMR